MLILLVGLPEDHAGEMPELVFQRQENHLAVWPLTADNQPSSFNERPIRQIFDIDTFEFVSNILLGSHLRPTCGIDLATGRYEESGGKLDRSAITIGFDFRDYKYIHAIELIDEKIGQLVKLVSDYDRKYNFAEIVFESNAFQ